MRCSDHNYRQWEVDNYDATPELQFPADWRVRLHPSASALTRFSINDQISVYFDIDGTLGAMRQPYWEMYPDTSGEPMRFLVGEEDQLISAITEALKNTQPS